MKYSQSMQQRTSIEKPRNAFVYQGKEKPGSQKIHIKIDKKCQIFIAVTRKLIEKISPLTSTHLTNFYGGKLTTTRLLININFQQTRNTNVARVAQQHLVTEGLQRQYCKHDKPSLMVKTSKP